MADRGQPIQILDLKPEPRGTSRITLRNEEFQSIVNQVGDNPVYVISIIGKPRSGKSFLLSYIVKYLEELESGQDEDEGLSHAEESKPLEGFPFRNGLHQQTRGIYMWSVPFFIKSEGNPPTAVLLMDTEGIFDTRTTEREQSLILGLSLFASDCVIYNIVRSCQDSDLKPLVQRLRAGFLQQPCGRNKRLHKLALLVRDWGVPGSYAYGGIGGNKFLTTLQGNPKLCAISEPTSYFEQIECCLLPNPGEKAKSNAFQGSSAELDKDFLHHLRQFAISFTNPDSVKSQMRELPVKDFPLYFDAFVRSFKTSRIPSSEALMNAMLKAKCTVVATDTFHWLKKQLGDLTEVYAKESNEFNVNSESLGKQAMEMFLDKLQVKGTGNTLVAISRRIFQRDVESALNEVTKDFEQTRSHFLTNEVVPAARIVNDTRFTPLDREEPRNKIGNVATPVLPSMLPPLSATEVRPPPPPPPLPPSLQIFKITPALVLEDEVKPDLAEPTKVTGSTHSQRKPQANYQFDFREELEKRLASRRKHIVDSDDDEPQREIASRGMNPTDIMHRMFSNIPSVQPTAHSLPPDVSDANDWEEHT